MTVHFILNERGQVQPADSIEWAVWFETAGEKSRVARDQIGDYFISTVFLGLDLSWDPDPMRDPLLYRPVLWETMAFDVIGQVVDLKRYDSHEAAVEGHAKMVELIREKMKVQESQLAEIKAGIGCELSVDQGVDPEKLGQGVNAPDQHHGQDDDLKNALPRLSDRQSGNDPDDQAGDQQHDQ